MSAAHKGMLPKIALALGVFVACFGGLELAGRLFMPIPPLPPPFVHHPETGWALPPGLNTQTDGFELRTNALGLRGHELSSHPDTFRALVLGDSTVYGWMVHEEETLSARLERHIGAYRRADVQNGGLQIGRASCRERV